MRNSVFVALIFGIVSLLCLLQWALQREVDRSPIYEHKVSVLEERLRQEELRYRLLQGDLRDLKQAVAVHMPATFQKANPVLPTEQRYAQRNLASLVIRFPEVQLGPSPAEQLLGRGKELFRQQEYHAAAESFRKIVEEHNESVHIPEAYFLLGESLFQQGRLEDCARVVDQMLTLFPENDLTGFLLVRLGEIFEKQYRPEDAVQVYRTILHRFNREDLRAQANSRLSQVKM